MAPEKRGLGEFESRDEVDVLKKKHKTFEKIKTYSMVEDFASTSAGSTVAGDTSTTSEHQDQKNTTDDSSLVEKDCQKGDLAQQMDDNSLTQLSSLEGEVIQQANDDDGASVYSTYSSSNSLFDEDPEREARIQAHADMKKTKIEKMNLQDAEHALLVAEESKRAYWYSLCDEVGEEWQRKKVFWNTKKDAKRLSLLGLQAEYVDAQRQIAKGKVAIEKRDQAGMRPEKRQLGPYEEERIEEGTLEWDLMVAEEKARAFWYVMDREVGEERVRKDVYKTAKKEAARLSGEELKEEYEMLVKEVEVCAKIVKRKRAAVEA